MDNKDVTTETNSSSNRVAGEDQSKAKPQPLLNKKLLLFMLAMVLANVGGSMYGPLLPLYLKDLNASVVQVGLFFTLSQVIPLALQILGGWISDSLGRLRSIAMGSLAGVFSYVGLILAPTWQFVLVGEGLGAITRSLVGPSFSAFIAEQSTEETRARVFGITETLFMIVAVVGPPLGGWLAYTYGFKVMLKCAGSLYFIATIIRVLMARAAAQDEESNPEKLSMKSLKTSLGTMLGLVLGGGLITWILLTDGVRDVAYALSFNLMPLYLDEIGGLTIKEIAWLESIFGIFMMMVTIPAGWLADKRGERIGIVMGFVLEFAALMIFMRVSNFWGYAVAWATLGVGVGMMSPSYQSLISKAVPEKLRGTAFGLFNTSLGLVSLPAPAIGAQMWERVSPRLPFQITAWMSLLAVIPAWFKFKLPSRTQAAESTAATTTD
ncbi:MAG: MFS transporter [Anaerolineales bacterium]|jgi:MFS family permease|nr:MFS transporter [Anaerolineales bacterium]